MDLGKYIAKTNLTPTLQLVVEAFIAKRSLTENSVNSTSAIGDVDDGPGTWYRSAADYQAATNNVAEKLGLEVLSYLGVDTAEYTDTGVEYLPPSYFEAGEAGETTPINPADYKDVEAFKMWLRGVKTMSHMLGMEMLSFMDVELEDIVDDKEAALESIAEELLSR